MSLDPQRASVVIDLLESATRTGTLEKQEAAAILSSWIEEQRHHQSGPPSPGPESQPPLPSSPPPLETTTTSLPTSFAGSASPQLLRDAGSFCGLSRVPSRHASVPNTPTGRQFPLFQTGGSSPMTPPPQQLQWQSSSTKTSFRSREKRQRRPRDSQKTSETMRSFLNVFAACAIGNGDKEMEEEKEEFEEEQPAVRRGAHFFLDAPPLPPLPTPPPGVTTLDCKDDAYALYDPAGGAEHHTYCSIDEDGDLVDCQTASSSATTTTPEKTTVGGGDQPSSSGTNDSGIYGSGCR